MWQSIPGIAILTKLESKSCCSWMFFVSKAKLKKCGLKQLVSIILNNEKYEKVLLYEISDVYENVSINL
jgi:hypothetical protein